MALRTGRDSNPRIRGQTPSKPNNATPVQRAPARARCGWRDSNPRLARARLTRYAVHRVANRKRCPAGFVSCRGSSSLVLGSPQSPYASGARAHKQTSRPGRSFAGSAFYVREQQTKARSDYCAGEHPVSISCLYPTGAAAARASSTDIACILLANRRTWRGCAAYPTACSVSRTTALSSP